MKDITDQDIKRALAAFGVEVKAQSENRKALVRRKLRNEIDRLRPYADRLLYGEKTKE
jgi:hypothetical protein